MRKAAIVLTVIFEIILVITAIQAVRLGIARTIWLSVFAMIFLLLPFLGVHFANKRRLLLPGYFRFGAILFIMMAQYLGEIMEFYTWFWWWDLMLHGIFGASSVAVFVNILSGYADKDGNCLQKYNAAEQAVFSFCLTITIGTLWEIFEFLGDYFFKSTMVKGGLEDTMSDLMIKLIAALVTVIILYFRNPAEEKRSKGV